MADLTDADVFVVGLVSDVFNVIGDNIEVAPKCTRHHRLRSRQLRHLQPRRQAHRHSRRVRMTRDAPSRRLHGRHPVKLTATENTKP